MVRCRWIFNAFVMFRWALINNEIKNDSFVAEVSRIYHRINVDGENERKLKIPDSFAFGCVLVIKYPFLGVHFFRIYTQTLTVWNDFHNSLNIV